MSSKKIPEGSVTIIKKAEDYVVLKRNGLTDRGMALRCMAQMLEMKEEELEIEDTGPGVNLCRVSAGRTEGATAFRAAVARLDDVDSL